MHLQELVRMAFIAATASSDRLKLEGLKMLQVSSPLIAPASSDRAGNWGHRVRGGGGGIVAFYCLEMTFQ